VCPNSARYCCEGFFFRFRMSPRSITIVVVGHAIDTYRTERECFESHTATPAAILENVGPAPASVKHSATGRVRCHPDL
jgi:hypothetical protein